MPDQTLLPSFGRRRFLQHSAGAAVLAGTVATATERGARAATAGALKPAATETLVVMARDLYPHDALDNSYYREAVVAIDAKLSADKEKHALLREGVAALDHAATKQKGKPYAALGTEADRVAVLKSIDGTPFFQAMRGEMVVALYNQPAVWAKLGYEGPSAEKGGYIHRGFNDIDWLQA